MAKHKDTFTPAEADEALQHMQNILIWLDRMPPKQLRLYLKLFDQFGKGLENGMGKRAIAKRLATLFRSLLKDLGT